MSDQDKKRNPDAENVELDAPASADELVASARLRDALEAVASEDPDLELVRSLRTAWSPDALDPRVHAEVLDDLPTDEELTLAAELRDALATRSGDAVLDALHAAWNPKELDPSEHRAIVVRAVGGASDGKVVAFRPRARTARVVVVATTALALAASVVVWMTNVQPARMEEPLAMTRSTQPLFGEPFKAGEASARIDRIAMARSSDYRDNRFAKWGVR